MLWISEHTTDRCVEEHLDSPSTHLALDEMVKSIRMEEDHAASAALSKTLMSMIKAFCTEGAYFGIRAKESDCPGNLDASLFKAVNKSVLFTVFHGAPYAQLTGRIFCREHFHNALASETDSFHDFMRIMYESATTKRRRLGPHPFRALCQEALHHQRLPLRFVGQADVAAMSTNSACEGRCPKWIWSTEGVSTYSLHAVCAHQCHFRG